MSKKTFTDSDIDAYVAKLIRDNPVKFIQVALVLIGKEMYKSNAGTFSFSQEADLDKGKRFKIEVKGKIKAATTRATQEK